MRFRYYFAVAVKYSHQRRFKKNANFLLISSAWNVEAKIDTSDYFEAEKIYME